MFCTMVEAANDVVIRICIGVGSASFLCLNDKGLIRLVLIRLNKWDKP